MTEKTKLKGPGEKLPAYQQGGYSVVPPGSGDAGAGDQPSAQDTVEGTEPRGPQQSNPPDLRSEASSKLNNAEATPGTGILPELDDDDPNMQPSG